MSQSNALNTGGGGTPVRVWDRFVRVAHWTIVAAFAIAFVTEDDVLTLHVWAGYLIGILVVLRVFWGLVGTRHARFTDFVCRPATALQYLRDLAKLRAPRHLGHSPAGGWMVIMLICFLLLTVASGIALYGAAENSGPVAGWFDAPAGSRVSPAPHDDEGKGGFVGDVLEEAHEVFANLTLLLVLLHIAGVLLASFAHRENLVRAMFTGKKRP
ncbi:MAG: cytochrome b/b6 domain-containing protein [Alphaproteobacteria bacterium]